MTSPSMPEAVLDTESQYKAVPHRGEVFIENEVCCYWNFSSARIGSVSKRTEWGWRPLGMPIIDKSTTKTLTQLGGGPVQMFSVRVPGFYYEIDSHVECVDAMDTPSGRITKWIDHHPLSAEKQQSLAFSSQSLEEYRARKQEAIAAARNSQR